MASRMKLVQKRPPIRRPMMRMWTTLRDLRLCHRTKVLLRRALPLEPNLAVRPLFNAALHERAPLSALGFLRKRRDEPALHLRWRDEFAVPNNLSIRRVA